VYSESRAYSTSAVDPSLIPTPLTTAQDEDESDWDGVGGDDEKSRLLSSPDSAP